MGSGPDEAQGAAQHQDRHVSGGRGCRADRYQIGREIGPTEFPGAHEAEGDQVEVARYHPTPQHRRRQQHHRGIQRSAQAPAPVHELDCQPIQELRVGGRLTLPAQVLAAGYQTDPEVRLPDAIHQ